MLPYYAEHFRTVEINYSFYKKPTVANAEAWAAQVPARFRFSLKAWGRITHQQRLRKTSASLAAFCTVARALGKRLGPILYQLPPDLPKDLPLLVAFLSELPEDLKAAFEFRHESWLCDEVYQALSDAGAALCVADAEETLSTPLVRTARFGYLRLRRAQYDAAALERWAKAIRAARFPGEVFAYFKHEDEANGPRFAEQLARLLE
jgi:uncharacterized protein YecE (DUF72 family)